LTNRELLCDNKDGPKNTLHTPKEETAMKFVLSIDEGNDAVQTNDAVSELLQWTARQIKAFPSKTRGVIIDVNGNKVGAWKYTKEEGE
jgi:hypothetical protein